MPLRDQGAVSLSQNAVGVAAELQGMWKQQYVQTVRRDRKCFRLRVDLRRRARGADNQPVPDATRYKQIDSPQTADLQRVISKEIGQDLIESLPFCIEDLPA